MNSPAAGVDGHYPHATWQPITVNHQPGRTARVRLAVAHIMQGTLTGTDAWFRNPAAQASSHFGVGRTGDVVQWVNCNDTAWHIAQGNPYSIGIEHEGFSGQPLTDDQMDATAAIFAWAAVKYNLDLWLNTRPYTGGGLSWHGLGGTPWGNHPDCPGSPVVHQLGDILAHARQLIHDQAA